MADGLQAQMLNTPNYALDAHFPPSYPNQGDLVFSQDSCVAPSLVIQPPVNQRSPPPRTFAPSPPSATYQLPYVQEGYNRVAPMQPNEAPGKIPQAVAVPQQQVPQPEPQPAAAPVGNAAQIDNHNGHQQHHNDHPTSNGADAFAAPTGYVVKRDPARINVIDNMDTYPGQSMSERLQNLVTSHPVVLFSKTHCPFCLELKRTFTEMGVATYVVEVDSAKDGGKVLTAAKSMSKHKTVPICYIKGQFVGGCDDVKMLHFEGKLVERISDLTAADQITGVDNFSTIRLVPPPRGDATNTLFWFPNTVNNWVVRLTGAFVTALCILSICFWKYTTGRWTSAFLLLDFSTRLIIGSQLSLLGMLATFVSSPLKPDFRAGAPKQFASLCGTIFALISTCCYFTGHHIAGACVIGGLAGAAGLEGFLDFCLGCVFYGIGIRMGLIPKCVYRIYTNTRQETVEAWNYENWPSYSTRPTPVFTEKGNKAALFYKKRTDEWTKDDYHLIRHMQVVYFIIPLSLAGLATAFKISSGMLALSLSRTDLRPSATWWHCWGIAAASIFCLFFILYTVRTVMYPKKCIKEWDCPLRSPAFGGITLCLMLFAFLLFDVGSDTSKGSTIPLFDADKLIDNNDFEWFARILFWLGAMGHLLLTIAKFGEWIGKRLELEHFHATWMILPVGCLVAALVAPVVPALNDWGALSPTLPAANDFSGIFDTRSFANLEISRFFYSFGFFMWIVLVTISFFKTATTHNSDDSIRHGTWIWVAAPALISIVDFLICYGRITLFSTPNLASECFASLSNYYYIAIIIFLGIGWSCLPYINFMARDKFNAFYFIDCFALDTLAAAAATNYSIYGHKTSKVIMIIFLVLATIANGVAVLHTLSNLVRRRTFFCPMQKWGPLAFMKLTHEAVRGFIPTMVKALNDVKVEDQNSVEAFSVMFATFIMLHEEHAKHEDELIFKTFNDFFPEQGKRYNDDHAEDRITLAHWKVMSQTLLSTHSPRPDRLAALKELQSSVPPFIEHFLEHLQGEEDNLNPVGKRYIPLDLQKQIARKAFELTPANRWEVLIPFLINNLPRFGQRIRLLKALTWAMPERSQQLGAIVYRGCDAVKWETIQFEMPEIIPRGVRNWRRYY